MWRLGDLRLRLDPRSEDGLALVVVLGLVTFFSLTTAIVVQMSTSTQSTAGGSAGQQNAYALAESGVGNAEAILNAQNSNATSPTLLGCSVSGSNINNSATPCTDLTVSTALGTVSYHGLYTQGQSTGTWTIVSTGDVATEGNPHLKRTISATASITGGGQSNNISVWNYVYSTAPPGAGCEVDISGNNIVIDTPVYVTGDLCISGQNAAISENTANGGQKVDVRVGGKVVISGNNAHIGSSVAPLTSGYSAQGCASTINGTPHTCTTADKWYVSQTDSPLTATPPTTDYPGYYTNGSPGPNHLCDITLTPSPNLTAAGNQPHAFDNDATMNGTNAQFNLTPASDYNCVTASGTLNWNHTTHILTVSGTIFFDGNVTTTDGSAMYHGLATLYVNGKFALSGNNAQLRAGCPSSPAAPNHQCAFGNTSSEWNPNKDLLLVITDVANGTSVDMSGNNVQFQGGLMCTPSSTAVLTGNNVTLEGPIICGKFTWGNNPVLYPLPTINSLPPGAPVPPNSPASIGVPTYTN